MKRGRLRMEGQLVDGREVVGQQVMFIKVLVFLGMGEHENKCIFPIPYFEVKSYTIRSIHSDFSSRGSLRRSIDCHVTLC